MKLEYNLIYSVELWLYIHLEPRLDSAGASWIPTTEVSSGESDVYLSRLQVTGNPLIIVELGRLKWWVGILGILLHCFMLTRAPLGVSSKPKPASHSTSFHQVDLALKMNLVQHHLAHLKPFGLQEWMILQKDIPRCLPASMRVWSQEACLIRWCFWRHFKASSWGKQWYTIGLWPKKPTWFPTLQNMLGCSVPHLTRRGHMREA